MALWTGVWAWCLGATLYLPEIWLTPERRQVARIPTAVGFQEKWRHALTLLRQVRAAGFELTAVIGDAEFGDVTQLRSTLHRLGLRYALGISSTLTVFVRRPRSSARSRERAADVPVPRIAWPTPITHWLFAMSPAACHDRRGDGSAGTTGRSPRGARASPRCA